MKREGEVVIVDAPGGMKIKMKLEGHTLMIKEYMNGSERAKYEIRLGSDEYDRVKNILKNAKTDEEVLQLFVGALRWKDVFFFKKKQNNVETVEDGEDYLKLETHNGVVKAKKILSLNGKHVVFVDQYGNVREAFLK